MSRVIGSALFSIILSMTLALAAAAMGAMHGAQTVRDTEMQAFIAVGGQLSDICGDMGHGHPSAGDCVFCLSPAGGALPDVAPAAMIVPRVHSASFTADAENCTVRRVRDPALGLRGPPVTV